MTQKPLKMWLVENLLVDLLHQMLAQSTVRLIEETSMPIDKSKPLDLGLFFRALTPLPMAVYTYFNKIFENLSILADEIRIYK